MSIRINRKSKAAEVAKVKPLQRERRNSVVHKRVWNCRLREIRDKHRLSMDVVAQNVGLSKTAYWQIEHGTDPMLTSARRIAGFFGMKVEDIWPELWSDEGKCNGRAKDRRR